MNTQLIRQVFGFAALGAVFVAGSGAARAGEILFNMTDPNNPVISISTVYNGSGGGCGAFAPYSQCAGDYFQTPTGTATVEALDDFTGNTKSISVSAGYTALVSDTYASAANPTEAGGYFYLSWEASNNEIGDLFQDFTTSFSATEPCYGGCAGQLTGGIQTAATLTYLNASGTVIGSDTIVLETAGSPTPEPGTAFTLIAGLALLGFGSARRPRFMGRRNSFRA